MYKETSSCAGGVSKEVKERGGRGPESLTEYCKLKNAVFMVC